MSAALKSIRSFLHIIGAGVAHEPVSPRHLSTILDVLGPQRPQA